jgi:hypothetical protein
MRRLAIPIVLLLAGCAHPTAETIDWTRDGTAPEQARADLHSCHRAAQAQVDREQPGSGLSSGPTTSQPSLVESLNAYDQDKRIDQITQRCMKLLGYQNLGEAPK